MLTRTSTWRCRSLITAFLLVARSAAVAVPGAVDSGYSPSVSARSYAPAIQPDGSVVLGGGYDSVNGVTRAYLARFGTAGALDPVYNPAGGGSGQAVYAIATHPDGGILAGGTFVTMSGVTRRKLARISAAGVLDSAFNLNFNDDIYSLALLPDGSVIAGGIFTTVNGTARNRVAKLQRNGTLDAGFNPNVNDNVRTIVPLPDGNLLLGGSFTTVGGTARPCLARITAAGGLLGSFAPVPDAAVYAMALQPDGRILIGGAFRFIGAVPRNRVARLNADGTLDTTFNPGANDLVRSIAIQTDGRIIFAGNFTAVAGQTRNRIARVNAAGALDGTFNPNANDVVFGVTLQDDGKVLAGGDFTTMGGVARNSYARLLNDAATDTLTVVSPGRVEWMRGGAAPEATSVNLDLSVGGGPWTPLAAAQRIPGGWAATGLNLPASGVIRARASTAGGYGNGTAGILQKSAAYMFSPLEWWRHANFGTIANTGNAADNADTDKDGLENLVEFAFGRNPAVPDAALLPEWQLVGDDYRLTFTKPAGVDGITVHAEYSTSMAPGSWTPAVSAGTAAQPLFLVPAITQRLYLRVRVAAP
jgi:uncharacterized delta-60 repeat protein